MFRELKVNISLKKNPKAGHIFIILFIVEYFTNFLNKILRVFNRLKVIKLFRFVYPSYSILWFKYHYTVINHSTLSRFNKPFIEKKCIDKLIYIPHSTKREAEHSKFRRL